MEVRLKRKIVFEDTSEELWGVYPYRKLITKKELSTYENDGGDVYTSSDTDSEARDIPIEDMKALIQKAEDAGANFIQIDWHCDHDEYNIYGSLITRATDEENADYEEAQVIKKQLEKEREIKQLEAKLLKLKNRK